MYAIRSYYDKLLSLTRLEILLALISRKILTTEFSAVAPLWEAALGLLDEAPADFVALIFEDERWQQAASLPFTREISRIGGIVAEFTEQP